MKEAELQLEVEKLLNARPRLIWHHCAGRAQHCRGGRGLPDLLILGTRLMFAELKGFGGHVQGAQVDWKYRLPLAGVAYEVWDDRDLRSGHIAEVLDSLM